MAFRSYQLTLTGAIQRLSDAFGDGAGIVDAAHDLPFRTLTFQPLKANTNDIFIGGSNQAALISSSVHAIRLDPADTQVVLILGSYDQGPLKLSDFYVLGTLNEVLLIGGVPY